MNVGYLHESKRCCHWWRRCHCYPSQQSLGRSSQRWTWERIHQLPSHRCQGSRAQWSSSIGWQSNGHDHQHHHKPILSIMELLVLYVANDTAMITYRTPMLGCHTCGHLDSLLGVVELGKDFFVRQSGHHLVRPCVIGNVMAILDTTHGTIGPIDNVGTNVEHG